MSQKQQQNSKGCAGGFVAALIVITILGFLGGIALDEPALLGISVAILAIVAIMGISYAKMSRAMKQDEKKKQQETDNLHQQMRAGEWAFPVDAFFTECGDKGIQQLSTDFEVRKAVLIAQNIAEKAGMPADCIPVYCSEDKVRGYFAAATEAKEAKEQQDRAAYEQKYKTPQKGNLSQADLEYRAYADKARVASPTEKRKLAIQYDLDDARNRLAVIEARRKHAQEVEQYLARASYQRPNDWATMGGIASGIAGPGAGAAVAAQAIAENQAILQQNAANLRSAVAVGNKLRDAIPSSQAVVQEIAALKKELEEAPYKVVFDEYDTAELYESLDLTASTRFASSMTLRVTNHRPNDDPQVKKAIDGTLLMRVYCEDILLDTVCVALPRNGVPCDKGYIVRAYPLAQYMIEGEKRNYRCEFEPIRLWMIEQ